MPKHIFRWAIGVVVVFWLITLLYPFFAAFVFPALGHQKFESLKTVLGQTGTFGDTFGAVNSLFSGLAFIALVYTLYQQNEQMERATRERREDAFLNALSSLANTYATIYACDPVTSNQENDDGAPRLLTASCTEGEKAYTVKGKLYTYAKGLEINLERLRRGEDIQFPPDVRS